MIEPFTLKTYFGILLLACLSLAPRCLLASVQVYIHDVNDMPLEKSTVSGDIIILARASMPVEYLYFKIDDEYYGGRSAVDVDDRIYSVAGTDSAGQFRAFPSAFFASGQHSLTVLARYLNGTTEWISVPFTIAESADKLDAGLKSESRYITANGRVQFDMQSLMDGAAGQFIFVLKEPVLGRLEYAGDDKIDYITEAETAGMDKLSLIAIGIDGGFTIRTIHLLIDCLSCRAPDTILNLTWNHNTDPVDYYLLYYGPSENEANQLLAYATDTAASYLAHEDLGLLSGDQICFRLRALSAYGVSDFSAAVCTDITQ